MQTVFFAIRYFVVQTSYKLFQDENIHPKEYFLVPFLKLAEVKYYNRIYTTRLVSPNSKERYILGYLLKSTDTHLIQLKDDLFQEQNIQNWEKLFFIIDTERQTLLFEYNTPIATPENVKNVLYQLTRKIALDNGYEIKLDFLVDKYAFWQIINDSSGLYQIAFDLNAPNLFGGSKKANEWIKSLKEKHNMTNVKVDFRNEKAELRYEEEELESYRDYADSGGGSWTLGVFQNGRKRKFYSSDHSRKKNIDFSVNDPRFIRENIPYILERLLKIIDSIDDYEL
jgi:hypothetical protein